MAEAVMRGNLSSTALARYGRSYWIGDELLGVVGVTPCWRGYCLAWALLSEESLKHPRDLTATTERLIERAKDALELRRMEMDVDTAHGAGLRWAITLGFQLEGIRRCYGFGGEDFYMLARTWP